MAFRKSERVGPLAGPYLWSLESRGRSTGYLHLQSIVANSIEIEKFIGIEDGQA